MHKRRTLFMVAILILFFALLSVDSKVYAEEVSTPTEAKSEAVEVKAEKEVTTTANEASPPVSTEDKSTESENFPTGGGSEAEALTTKKPELETVDDDQSDDLLTSPDNKGEPSQERPEEAEKAQAAEEDEKADEPILLNEENQEEDSDEKGVLAEVQDQVDPSEEGKDSETDQVTEPVDPEADEENTEATEADEKEAAEAGEILKEGEVLEVDALAKEPMAFGAGGGTQAK